MWSCVVNYSGCTSGATVKWWNMNKWCSKSSGLEGLNIWFVFFILSAINYVSLIVRWKAKSYIKGLPKVEKKELQKLFSTTNPQGRRTLSCFSVGSLPCSPSQHFCFCLLLTQLCLCWSACCCSTHRAERRPRRLSVCRTSPTSEIRMRRRKHSYTTTR